MPIYEYISENPDDPGQSCPVCRRGFELRRPVDRAPLEKCLVCKHPVPEVTKPLSVSDAKAAGFTVLERRDKGVYEKL